MMALMLLVAITLVSFVYVQSKLTEGRLKRAQAQLNAISGMRVALGQLQLLSGDDQRVTATADIFGGNGNDSLPSGKAVDGKRFWTGVWATGGLDKSKIRDWSVYSPDKKPFLGWLVSDYNSSKEIFSPLEAPLNRESATGNTGKTLLSSVQKAFDADDEKLDLVTLVGAGTLGSDRDAADELSLKQREVRVRRVPIMRFSAATDEMLRTNSGSFAYWVGDEGVKAKVNIPDGTDEKFLKKAAWDQLFNVVSQRNGVSLLTGLSRFDSWWEKDTESAKVSAGTRLGYVDSAVAFPLYVSALGGNSTEIKSSAQKLFHDVSFVSQGIFTDTYNGGLKTDLSLAFEMPWEREGQWKKGFRDIKQFHGSGEKNNMNLMDKFKVPSDEQWWTKQPSDGLGYLYEIATGESSRNEIISGNEVKYLRGPTWDLVRNYYRLYKREDENKGFRGLKPKNNDSWLAVGSRPYTYLSGAKSHQIRSKDGSDGYIGEKYNFSSMVCRHTGTSWGRWPALLTEVDGASHQRVQKAAKDCFETQYEINVPQSMRIAPVVRRIVVRCSIIMNQDTAAICFDPIITIHNPYNVPIEFFGFGALWTKFFPFTLKLIRDDEKNWPGTSSNEKSYKGEELFGQNAWDWRIFSRLFAGTKSINQNPSGTIRLLPGEVKVLFPASSGITTDKAALSLTNTVGSICDFQYEEKSTATRNLSGIDVAALASEKDEDGNPVSVQYHVEIQPIPDSLSNYNDLDIFAFHLYSPESSNGANLQTRTGMLRSWGNQGSIAFADVADTSDYDLTQVVAFRRYFPRDGSGIKSDGTLTQTSESGVTNAEKQYVAYIDVQNFGALDTDFAKNETAFAGPLVSNARPWVVTPVSWDGGIFDRNVGIAWKKTLLQDNGMSPVDNTNSGENTRGYWGDSSGSAKGETNIVLFEIPTAPLVSLGQLQHVECSVLDMEPSYVIGNSYSHIGFKNSELNEVLVWPEAGYMKEDSDRYSGRQSPQPRGDTPFAANLNLFDRYFFSGINVGTANTSQHKDINTFIEKAFSTDADSNPFPNKRISLIRDFGDRKESEVKSDFYDPEKVARDLIFDGSFNVNSTSKEAWKAVLAGLHGKLLKIDGAFKKASDTPFVRFISLIGSKLGGFGSAKGGDDGNGWRWYSSLDDSQLDKLAEAIVKQVRERGPFMSMGDFVNRRLTTEETGKAGALQAAIDDSEVNDAQAKSFSDGNASNPDSSRYPNLFPTGEKLAKAGVPGYVTQGDILSAIAPSLSARSDTFTIRAYGDVFGLNGTPEARAWCEAVVQRVPEFFDPQNDEESSEEDDVLDVVKFRENYRDSQNDEIAGRGEKYVLEKFERNDKLSAVNKLFGRRYKIVSFRWLSQDEL